MDMTYLIYCIQRLCIYIKVNKHIFRVQGKAFDTKYADIFGSYSMKCICPLP